MAIEAFMASRPGDPSRVTLRLITAADQDEFLGLAAASAGLHHPWMTLAVTPQEFQAYLRRFDHVMARIRACPNAEAGAQAPMSARTSSTVRFASATNPGFVSG